MSVRIPVSADTSGVDKLREAFDRLTKSASNLSKTKLDHPELREDLRLMKELNDQFEYIKKHGVGTDAATIRRGGYKDASEWVTKSRSQFTSDAAYRNHVNRTFGTMVDHGGSGEGSGGGGDYRDWSRHRETMWSSAKNGLGFAAGLAGIPIGGALLSRAVGNATNEATGIDSLRKTLRDTTTDFEQLKVSVRATAAGMGLTTQESINLSRSWVGLTNETSALATNKAVTYSTGLARGYGLEPESVTQGLGRAQYMGQNPKQFASMLAEAVQGGHMNGQVEQTMQAMLRWTETSSRMLVDRSTTSEFTKAYTDLNASGMAGFKGQGAEALLNKINASVMGGGAAGEAGQYFSSRVLSKAGISNPWAQKHKLEEGMFGQLGNGQSTMGAMMAQLDADYGPGMSMQKMSAGANMFGVSMHQFDKYASLKPADISKTKGLLGKLGINSENIEGNSLASMYEIGGADDAGLSALRNQYSKRATDKEKNELSGAKGDELRELLIKFVDRNGATATEGDKIRDTNAKLDQLITIIGENVYGALLELKEAVVEAYNAARKHLGYLGINLPGIGKEKNAGAPAPSGMPTTASGVLSDMGHGAANWGNRIWHGLGGTSNLFGSDPSQVSDHFANNLAERESGDWKHPRGKFAIGSMTMTGSRSTPVVYGKYQLSTAEINKYGTGGIPFSEWRHNEKAQDETFKRYLAGSINEMKRGHLTDKLGMILPNGQPLTMDGLMAAYHLGGPGGASAVTRGKGGGRDLFGTSPMGYAMAFSGGTALPAGHAHGGGADKNVEVHLNISTNNGPPVRLHAPKVGINPPTSNGRLMEQQKHDAGSTRVMNANDHAYDVPFDKQILASGGIY